MQLKVNLNTEPPYTRKSSKVFFFFFENKHDQRLTREVFHTSNWVKNKKKKKMFE